MPNVPATPHLPTQEGIRGPSVVVVVGVVVGEVVHATSQSSTCGVAGHAAPSCAAGTTTVATRERRPPMNAPSHAAPLDAIHSLQSPHMTSQSTGAGVVDGVEVAVDVGVAVGVEVVHSEK